MINFEIPMWVASCCGNEKNCLYTEGKVVTSEDELKEAVANDHVFIQFRNNYRCEANFIKTATLVVDCDNSHSDDPKDWIHKEDVEMAFPGVAFVIYTSRNHLKIKGNKSARPKFHVIFFINECLKAKEYKTLLERIQSYFPYFDTKALDAARFFYGNDLSEVFFIEGEMNLSQFFGEEDAFANLGEEIVEGNRNATMFNWAVRAMKRYGDGADTKKQFYVQADKCTPPLDDEELASIWRSANQYYKKIAAQPDYVPPTEYNNPTPANWQPPIPFGDFEMDEFPIDALPKDIADYVSQIAESTQTPVDMAGTASLSVTSTCTQGKFEIEGKSDWIEPVNTYAEIILPPSERKSAVLNGMTRPINKYESNYNRQHSASVEANKMQKRILERKQKALEDAIAKGKAEPDELEQMAQQIADFQEIKPLQLYVDDITTEKLVSVLSDNGGHASLISSEGGIFDTLAGIYTKNVNIDVMLKAYSGDSIRVDRIGRESECINNPALTILLMAQPSVVSDVLSNTTFRGRGLTARFLYCMPKSSVGNRNYRSKTIDPEVAERYEKLIFNMLQDEYTDEPELITLSEEADRLLGEFAEQLEPMLVRELADISDWAGKLVGNTLRIAGLLCRASVIRCHDFLDKPDPLVVDGPTMANAIRLGKYYLNHAQAAFSTLPVNAMCQQARKILDAITEKELMEFDRREAMRMCRTFKTVAEIQPILDFLEDYGYIAVKPQEQLRTGRPPLPKYEVNPWVYRV